MSLAERADALVEDWHEGVPSAEQFSWCCRAAGALSSLSWAHEILAELVELKTLKANAWTTPGQGKKQRLAMLAEYERRSEIAWGAARMLLRGPENQAVQSAIDEQTGRYTLR